MEYLLIQLLNFLITSFSIFFIIRHLNKLKKKDAETKPTQPSEEIILLRDIRDNLKK